MLAKRLDQLVAATSLYELYNIFDVTKLNNKKFWTSSLSGHSPAEAKPKGKAGGAAKFSTTCGLEHK